ncbi:helicase-related protein [Bacillus toyonensis]|uniref:helicase-related protein n=1 Tax=Bacillus toyonensis TaxID=155322 RepID=UPI000BF44994|nr:helicase-related protein [Bacillus toyonensis]PGA08701.1 helicase [Bacillus toyonensis]PGB41545.1 helicase [Bacillus toyonensis]PGE40430.1 helicase [Bacillus toyonensis]PHC93174.1 helicase [Bacillus toyonensis]
MVIPLENACNNRQKVIDNVKEEIIGPGQIRNHYIKFNPIGNTIFESREELYKSYYWEVGGTKEEILQRETPTQRYVSGHLFPLGTNESDEVTLETPIVTDSNEAQESEQMDKLFGHKEGLETTEDDGEVELFPQRNDFMPSTMGLTFCVDKDVTELKVTLEGGAYTPHNVKVKGESNSVQWWLRETIKGIWDLPLSQLIKQRQIEKYVEMKNKKVEGFSQYHIQFQAKLREVRGKYIITISVTNRSAIQNFNRQQLILFQAIMSINTPEGQSFSVYPKQYEMKEKLTEEEASTELLYRNEDVYAFGHGCAANWEQNSKNIQQLSTTFMPEYEALSMTPNVFVNQEGEEVELEIKMSDLAGLSSDAPPRKILNPLIKGYREWIETKWREIDNVPRRLKFIAEKHLKLCKESLDRMEKGLELLEDPQILEAFRLANKAMLLQQVNGKDRRFGRIEEKQILFDKSFTESVNDESRLKSASNTWRAFQIAFILMSIDSLVDEKCTSREVVDLIWFPTGGGKTEAYLGVAAFQMILRRLKNPLDAGVDVMMRYTLRLLTADQFQRSSRLICALEYLRRKNNLKLGDIPFSIGIWVGSNTTPNSNKSAKILLRKLQKNEKNAQQFIVNSCSWCGANLGYYHETGSKRKHYFGYQIKDDKLVAHCPDKNCHFHEELPIYIVDETIYEKRPTFLIGTVDKFVQLVWQPKARALFGIDPKGNRVISPPALIVQDELHLISGPLGTLTGLFEALVEELCLKDLDGKVVKPKIIAATATIKQFEEQSRALFGRKNARLFPSPGLENEDSFFATPAINKELDKPMPGRKYIGVYTTTVRIMMSQVMTFSAILQATSEISVEERDPYWTLLSFYNTLRELGGGLTLSQTDIPQYSNSMALRKDLKKDTRYVNNILELTSRKQSFEIAKTIDDLKLEYRPNKAKKDINSTIDLCLASNIIEVGVDIDRLSVMAIVGQPKMTAQYIQVSGRVGRRWWERPGLIFTLYSNTKSRDKSHFEHFREYHQKLYAQVEPTSVTPFSDSCLDRGLHAIVVGFLRQALSDDVARVPDWKEIQKHLNKILAFYNRLIERAKLVDLEQVGELQSRFRDILKRLEKGSYTAWRVDPKVNGYMYSAGTTIPHALKANAEPMINSMRNVDSECRGVISQIYRSNNDDNDSTKSDWEALFS